MAMMLRLIFNHQNPLRESIINAPSPLAGEGWGEGLIIATHRQYLDTGLRQRYLDTGFRWYDK
jgi:hypothetical protein